MKNFKIIVPWFLFFVMLGLYLFKPKEQEIRTQYIYSKPKIIYRELIVTRIIPFVIKEEVVKEVEKELELDLSEEDIDLLAKLVHAEAGNQDMVGKRLVVDVVLNRLTSEKYPNTVYGVLYQDSQFSTASYLSSIKPTDEDYEAVYKELYERLDYDILYFRNGGYHSYGSPAYQHGAHYFNVGSD